MKKKTKDIKFEIGSDCLDCEYEFRAFVYDKFDINFCPNCGSDQFRNLWFAEVNHLKQYI
jgi:Zn finger protein HypA/HybF involved in hydrogenase expression